MTYLINAIYLITVVYSGTAILTVSSQPADLGAFGGSHHNDLPNGISSFSLPAAEERMVNEPYVLAFINYTYTGILDGQTYKFAEEKAKYGEGRIFNVRGILVHVTAKDDFNDHTACSPQIRGTRGRDFPAPGTWVALIKRGNCNFEDKVRHAWMYKALGVIVYNDRDSNNLDKMKIVETERNITAVFTFKWLGEQMAQIVDEGNELITTISEGRYSKTIQNINRTSVLFVSISFILLMIISLVWLIFYYIQRFRYLQTKDRKSRQLCTVAKRIISKIPTKNIKSDDKEIDNDCCAICIEPYKVTDLIRVLPCRHEFHKFCIDPWLLEHRTCPMCKMDILKHYGFVFTGSQESILQLDLDTEEGEQNGGRSDGDVDNMPYINRTRSVSPTFVIQLDHENLRRSSIDSSSRSTTFHRNSIPEAYVIVNNENNDIVVVENGLKSKFEGYANALKIQPIVEGEEKLEKIRESISLPCTLRKCKSIDSCRGSNNCYVWGMDFHQLNKKMDGNKIATAAVVGEKTMVKSKTILGVAGDHQQPSGQSEVQSQSSHQQNCDNALLLADRGSDGDDDGFPTDDESVQLNAANSEHESITYCANTVTTHSDYDNHDK